VSCNILSTLLPPSMSKVDCSASIISTSLYSMLYVLVGECVLWRYNKRIRDMCSANPNHARINHAFNRICRAVVQIQSRSKSA
jgi:hypothetical protein